ncbi:MAG: response regulator [Bacteroidetes bacterium]|nr:MAG: response regulator [Bacteroidota bacterium]
MKMNVLIIEDNAVMSELIREGLTIANGFSFDSSETLSSGLFKATRHEYDIVLLDLNLPDSKGVDTLVRFRKATGNSIPVIVVTGEEDLKTLISVQRKGASDVFTKTKLRWDELSKSLHDVVRIHRSPKIFREAKTQLNEAFTTLRMGVVHG